MDTRHLIDPELLPLLEMMPTAQFNAETLPLIRQMSEARFEFIGEPALKGEVKEITGPGGPLDVYWFDPAPGTANRAALLHIHGGGMVIGSARSSQHIPAAMAAKLGIPVASVDYRLAPEHPFPAPQDDCLAALAWLADHTAALGIDQAADWPRRLR
jgi:acetyl esterase